MVVLVIININNCNHSNLLKMDLVIKLSIIRINHLMKKMKRKKKNKVIMNNKIAKKKVKKVVMMRSKKMTKMKIQKKMMIDKEDNGK
jgi:hypothetical protein